MPQRKSAAAAAYKPETKRRLLDALAVLPRASVQHITVSVPLFGVVPVGEVLDDLGFQDSVQSLTFVPGGITRLLGVPDRVTRVDCEHNHLESLAELGPGLHTLNATHNCLRGTVDVSHLSNLRHLDLSDNTIERFARGGRDDDEKEEEEDAADDDDDADQGFAPSLVSVNVSRNHLVGRLDLRACVGMRMLDARFNPPRLQICVAGTSAVVLPPAGAEPVLRLTTREGHNNTTTSVAQLTLTGGSLGSSGSGSSGSEEVEQQRATETPGFAPMRLPKGYRDQVRAFFEAKQEYEKSLAKMRVEGGGGEPKCIRCGRAGGGMLFSGRDQVYAARCLALPRPCGFSIKVDRGRFVPLRAHATALRTRLVAARDSMIRLQYDALLGHLRADAVAEQFPNQVRRYNGLLSQYREFERRADDHFFNARQKRTAAAIRAQMAELAAEVSGLVADRKWTQAARMQSRDIRPLADDLTAAVCPNRGAIVDDEPKGVGRSVTVLHDVVQHDPDVLTREYNIGAMM